MPETAVVEYNITDAVIAEMKSIYMGLTITDLDDKEQFDAVHSARMTVKGKRVEVEKRRKELKADALAWGKKVDGKAKEIFEKLEPIETHLDREEKKFTDEKKRVKEEADRLEREKIEKRVADLAEFGATYPFFTVAAWDETEYENALLLAMEKHEAEQKRLAEEKAARKAESERLEKLRLEMDEKQRVIDEANAKAAAEKASLEAEKKAFEDEKRKEQDRKDREAFELRAKADAAIAAEKAEKERQEQAVWEAKQKAEAEAAKKARQEALKPDKEKLIGYAEAILALSIPEVVSDEARVVREYALRVIGLEADEIIKQAKEL